MRRQWAGNRAIPSCSPALRWPPRSGRYTKRLILLGMHNQSANVETIPSVAYCPAGGNRGELNSTCASIPVAILNLLKLVIRFSLVRGPDLGANLRHGVVVQFRLLGDGLHHLREIGALGLGALGPFVGHL